mmetsp:Transcript_30830/g.91727  ORF Transcript_30830/g.91727 Transcript_30830/m.91727 type:complete len:210 (-) Transcript_30830:914-1543(-)
MRNTVGERAAAKEAGAVDHVKALRLGGQRRLQRRPRRGVAGVAECEVRGEEREAGHLNVDAVHQFHVNGAVLCGPKQNDAGHVEREHHASNGKERPHQHVHVPANLCQLLAVVHVTAAVDLASDLTRVRSRQRAARVDALERRGAAAATIAAALAGRLPVSRQPGKADAACNAFAGLAAVAGVSVAIERPAVLRLVAVIVHPRRWAVDR